MRVARRVGRSGSLLLLLALVAAARSASAQSAAPPTPPRLDRSFDLQLFHPAVGARGYITLDSAEVAEHGLWHVGMVASYAHAPFSYRLSTIDAEGTRDTITQSPVQNLATAELVAALGLFHRFEIGAALPLATTWSGDAFDAYGGPAGTAATVWSAGDLRLEGKAQLVRFAHVFLLGLSAAATLPTASSSAFLGEKTVTGRARALLEVHHGDSLRALAMVGGLFRGQSQFFATPEGNAMLYGAAVELKPTDQIGLVGEVNGRVASRYKDTNPAEIDAAMRFSLPAWLDLLVGAGFGLDKGVGSPALRAFVGLGWSPDFRDRDNDGIPDADDLCPDEPEDRDGFQDSDGCPDPDNDLDDIPDAIDKCPNQAEDFDNFQDEDGCPDLDNDGDGIPDDQDPCPNQPEDGKGRRPHDGCPSSADDSDGDGIPDVRDKCPDEPEDKDGFQDDDGCPDYDNDDDGILDVYDACPNEPEDMDGFQDDDGCPDPDNDHDGIPDATDKCPNEPETLNHVRDDDGCPEPGPELVRLGEGDARIYVAERIDFSRDRGGKPALAATTQGTLDLVARAIKNHPEVERVRIDVRGLDLDKQATVEHAQLIVQALVERGVEPARLKASGQGRGPDGVDFVVESRRKPHARVAIPQVLPAEEAPAPPVSESGVIPAATALPSVPDAGVALPDGAPPAAAPAPDDNSHSRDGGVAPAQLEVGHSAN